MGAFLAVCAVLALSAGAEDAAHKVDSQVTQPVLGEVQQAAANLGNPNAAPMAPSWGTWAAQMFPPFAPIARFIQREIVDPWYSRTQGSASAAATALASSDPNATAAAPPDPSVEDLAQRIKAFLGMSEQTSQPPALKPPKIKREKRKDSIGLVRQP